MVEIRNRAGYVQNVIKSIALAKEATRIAQGCTAHTVSRIFSSSEKTFV